MRPYYDDGNGIVIYHGDCYELLPLVPRVDLLMTDPPYAAAATTTVTGFAREKWGINWGDMSMVLLMARTVFERIRLEASSEVYWFCDDFSFAAMLPMFVREWPIVQKVVWDKDMLGIGARHRRQTETVIYAARGDTNWLTTDGRDLIRHRPVYADKEHPSGKPVEVLQRLMRQSRWACAIDPFMGSGSTLVAAKRLGRAAIGIEIEERYCEIAAKRLAQGALPLEMGVEVGR